MEESGTRSIRLTQVLLVAPGLAQRVGLRSLVAAHPDFYLLAEVASVASLEEVYSDADVILAASLEAGDLERLLEYQIPVLLLTDRQEDIQMLARAGLAGWGILPEDCSQNELFSALQAAADGLLVGSLIFLQALFSPNPSLAASQHEMPEPLTPRELEVLQQMAQGMANKQIALQLGISEHTVKFHLTSIYSKLDVSSRIEAVNAGMRRGLIAL